jgi:hypothetical protein
MHAGAEAMRDPESPLLNGRLIARINLRAAALDFSGPTWRVGLGLLRPFDGI